MSTASKCVVDLPGVGANYQDHLEATVQCEVKDPISIAGEDKGLRAVGHMLQYMLTKTGLLTSTVVESGGFADTSGTGEPDVQFHVLPTFIGFADRLAEPGHGISIGPCVLRPQSRGSVRLRSKNPAGLRTIRRQFVCRAAGRRHARARRRTRDSDQRGALARPIGKASRPAGAWAWKKIETRFAITSARYQRPYSILRARPKWARLTIRCQWSRRI